MIFRFFKILWKFSRPHTIIGSVVSITTLWLIALIGAPVKDYLGLLLITLFSGITCNIFIVGLNQIIDVDLDKINKPNLPLASGSLSLTHARKIVALSLTLSLLSAFYTGWILGVLILVICIIGIAYSVPPIQLKKHHLPAAIAITGVRGILVNLGMYLHFVYNAGIMSIDEVRHINLKTWPDALWVLTGFVVAFSIAIAWFKDLPDTKGDAAYNFKTLALTTSPRKAWMSGTLLVTIAYIICIFWSYISGMQLLFIFHLAALILFLINATFVKMHVPASITRFYMLFWIFFFAEYIVFGVWAWLH